MPKLKLWHEVRRGEAVGSQVVKLQDALARKEHYASKLETLLHYSAVVPGQPEQPASDRKLAANDSLLDVLEAAKQQLLKGGKPSTA